MNYSRVAKTTFYERAHIDIIVFYVINIIIINILLLISSLLPVCKICYSIFSSKTQSCVSIIFLYNALHEQSLLHFCISF